VCVPIIIRAKNRPCSQVLKIDMRKNGEEGRES